MLLESLLLVVFIVCYVLGGQGMKWARRWVGPSVFGGGTFLNITLMGGFAWLVILGSAWYLLAANSFSYGEKFTQNILWKKVFFRGLCGMMYGLAGLLIGIGTGHKSYGFMQLVSAILGTIALGVLNPFKGIGDKGVELEDALIALASVGLILLLV